MIHFCFRLVLSSILFSYASANFLINEIFFSATFDVISYWWSFLTQTRLNFHCIHGVHNWRDCVIFHNIFRKDCYIQVLPWNLHSKRARSFQPNLPLFSLDLSYQSVFSKCMWTLYFALKLSVVWSATNCSNFTCFTKCFDVLLKLRSSVILEVFWRAMLVINSFQLRYNMACFFFVLKALTIDFHWKHPSGTKYIGSIFHHGLLEDLWDQLNKFDAVSARPLLLLVGTCFVSIALNCLYRWSLGVAFRTWRLLRPTTLSAALKRNFSAPADLLLVEARLITLDSLFSLWDLLLSRYSSSRSLPSKNNVFALRRNQAFLANFSNVIDNLHLACPSNLRRFCNNKLSFH